MNINNIRYNIEESKESLPTLSITDHNGKKIYLHSKYHPSDEAALLKNKFEPEKYDALIVLGLGLGYHLQPLKDLHAWYKIIIIIDAIPGIERNLKANPRTGFLAECSNIKFITGRSLNYIENMLSEEIDLDNIRGLNIIEHPSSLRVFAEYYKDITKTIETVLNRKASNKATRKAFGMLYLRNIIKNFKYISSLYPVSAFSATLNGYPALVITSGPTIEKYINIIKEKQDNIFIIAVDSIVKVLLKNNIRPDFFISIDPQPFVYEHLLALNTEGIIPVFTVSSNPLLIKKYSSGPALLSLNTHPFAQILENTAPGIIGSTDSTTGTVSGDAIKTAHAFGFKEIGILGFDFSFPEFRIYPRGTAYQFRFSCISSRYTPVETINLNYIMKSSRGVKYNGKFTRKSFIQYKESIERFIKESDIKNLYSINYDGIPVKRIENMNMHSFLDSFCKASLDKPEIIKQILSVSAKINSDCIFKIKNIMRNKTILKEFLHASLDSKSDVHKIIRVESFIIKAIENQNP